MAKVTDVAQYILGKTGEITKWKLQKLVYYAQAWHLVWDDEPLFEDEFQAWRTGPVCVALHQRHNGEYRISTIGGDGRRLTDSERETIDVVVDVYAKFEGQELANLTYTEQPWQDARIGLAEDDKGSQVISHDAMKRFYASL